MSIFVIWKKMWFILALILPLACLSPKVANAEDIKCDEQYQLTHYFQKMWVDLTIESQESFLSCLKTYTLLGRKGDQHGENSRFDNNTSSYMIAVLQNNPIGFFEYMERNPKFYFAWVKDAENKNFYWALDAPCGKAEQLKQIILILTAQDSQLKKFKTYRAFMPIISNIRCEVPYEK